MSNKYSMTADLRLKARFLAKLVTMILIWPSGAYFSVPESANSDDIISDWSGVAPLPRLTAHCATALGMLNAVYMEHNSIIPIAAIYLSRYRKAKGKPVEGGKVIELWHTAVVLAYKWLKDGWVGRMTMLWNTIPVVGEWSLLSAEHSFLDVIDYDLMVKVDTFAGVCEVLKLLKGSGGF
ncbi:hypothetical protein BCR34DRAFT_618089 [Clohesyomyces aquaticus]|uniref:Uncharacterized protein n=1 Tax=Clohesyomyces aquaticus TaxID=1231657 RepID=A0A1Y1YWY0_9PLEO|nr:hypothetical protein BCR34DRAFT_618089 [Clohesyomyces aquaticus]